MSDFNFQIVGDASKADQSIRKVEAGLEGVKKKAKEVSDNVQGMHDRIEGIGDVMNFIGGAAALGGMKSLAEGVENIIHDAEALEDRYTTLANHALKFATAGKSVNMVIAEQQALAHQLRANLGQSMNLYDAVGDATDELGLSERQLTALTQTLGEGALLAGKNFDSAGNVIARLAIATAAGADGARELKSILRDFPELGQALAKAWDTDKAGVIDMVTSGKKNIQDLTDVWIDQSNEIHKSAEARKRTHEEERAEYMQTAEILLNQGVPAEAAYSAGGQAMVKMLRDTVPPAKSTSQVMTEIAHKLSDQATEWKRVADRAAEALRDKIVQGSKAASAALGSLGTQVTKLVDALASDGLYAVAKAADPWFVKPDAPKKIAAVNREIDEYVRLVQELNKPEQDAIRNYNLLNQAYMNGAINARVFAEEQEKIRNQLIEFGRIDVQSVTQPLGAPTDPTKGIDTASLMQPNIAVQKLTEDIKNADDERRKLVEGFVDLGYTLAEAAAQGGNSFAAAGKRMLDSLAEVMIKALATKAIMSALGSGGGGGGEGGAASLILGGLGGFANGGSFTVGGSSGTDQNLVAFRATRGERVTVETPAQQGSSVGGAATASLRVVNNYQDDPRAVRQAFSDRAGQATIYNTMQRMPRERRRMR